MVAENIMGAVICVLCAWLCGGIFLGLGFQARKAEKPVSFWSGSTVAPTSVRDVPAYNRENAIMWMVYSVPYWIAGVFGLLIVFGDWGGIVYFMILMLSAVPGIPMLIGHYKRIARKYICT